MINNQLVAYIKQQLYLNVGKETIISNLKTQGWTDVDLEEAFQFIDLPKNDIVLPTPLVVNNVAPSLAQSPKNNKTLIILISTLIVVCAGSFFYFYVYIPQKEAKVAAEIKKAEDIKYIELQQTAIKSENSFISFTKEDYDLLLSRPVINPGIINPTNVTGITVGYDYDSDFNIKTAIPYIPNLFNDEQVFVRINSILTKEGKEIFDKESSFEEDNDMFTDIDLEKKNSESGPFLYGERSVHITDNKESDVIDGVSGSLILNLPTNIKSASFSKDDIGKSKPFADGNITIETIEGDSVEFSFDGKQDIQGFSAKDSSGKKIRKTGYSMGERSYGISFDGDVSSFEVISYDIYKKTYPFTIGKISTSVEPKTTDNSTIPKTADAPEEVLNNEIPVTSDEKIAIENSFISLGTIIKKNDFNTFKKYITESGNQEFIQSLKDAEKDSPKEIKSNLAELYKTFFSGITHNSFKDSKITWTKKSSDTIDVGGLPAGVMDIDMVCTHTFKNVKSVWYWTAPDCN